MLQNPSIHNLYHLPLQIPLQYPDYYKFKEYIQNLLNKLPDKVTLEDIQYHLYVLEKIEKGIQRGAG